MPSVEQNVQTWDEDYEWTKAGDEWSAAWGGAKAQWEGAIQPRISSYLPAGTILEIAPGFGRWTDFLRLHTERLIAVDLAENCVEVCRKRFAGIPGLEFHLNDGKSLAMVDDSSLDFVFSFDSLVHAEADVLQAYLEQLARKMKPDAVGFIHHSNIGSYRREFAFGQRLPTKVRHGLMRLGLLERTHWRAFSMTAERFAVQCEAVGLQCIHQELVNWGGKKLIDSFSCFTPQGSRHARANRVVENPQFMHEAAEIRRATTRAGE